MFTSRRFAGNGLAVVHDADGVSDATMRAFARETQLSETSFLQSPRAPEATYRHRIWMVRHEIPFAGHPSLGAAVAHVRAAGQASATVVQETGAGLQPVDVEVAGDLARTSMLQEPASFGPELEAGDTIGLAGLDEADLALPVQVVGTGVAQIVAVVRDAAVLERCRQPDYAALANLLDANGAVVLYIAAVDGERAVARSFFPGGEDAATGSAAGPLCALVHARHGIERLEIEQGAAIGRPSRLDAAIEGDRVRVGGEAVVVMDGQAALDT